MVSNSKQKSLEARIDRHLYNFFAASAVPLLKTISGGRSKYQAEEFRGSSRTELS